MSGTVHVLCSPSIAPAFALVGLPAIEASSGPDAATRLAEIRARPEVAVVLIEADLYEALPEDVVRSLAVSPLPVVVPFPGPVWVERPLAEAYVVELLRRAIGYRVRLR
jgi:vacuolar-type H+-ATPase subunit F/Vma7